MISFGVYSKFIQSFMYNFFYLYIRHIVLFLLYTTDSQSYYHLLSYHTVPVGPVGPVDPIIPVNPLGPVGPVSP